MDLNFNQKLLLGFLAFFLLGAGIALVFLPDDRSSENEDSNDAVVTNTQITAKEAKSQGDIEYVNFLLKEIDADLDFLRETLVSEGQESGFSIVSEVQAQSTTTDEELEQISEIVSDIDDNFTEIEVIVDENEDDLLEIIDLLNEELATLESEYEIIVEQADSRTLIVISSIDRNFDEIDRAVVASAVNRLEDDAITVSELENYLERLSRKRSAYVDILASISESVSDEDVVLITEVLEDTASLIEDTRTQIDNGFYLSAYENLEVVDDSLDRIEDIIDAYLIDDNTEDTALLRIKAEERIDNARDKINKAEEEVIEENPDSTIVVRINELITSAENALAEAESAYEIGNYTEAISLGTESREQAKVAIKLANKNSLEELDERLEDALESIEEAREEIETAKELNGDLAKIQRAERLLSEAERLNGIGNFVAAERLADNAEDFAESSYEDEDEADEMEREREEQRERGERDDMDRSRERDQSDENEDEDESEEDEDFEGDSENDEFDDDDNLGEEVDEDEEDRDDEDEDISDKSGEDDEDEEDDSDDDGQEGDSQGEFDSANYISNEDLEMYLKYMMKN